MSSPSKTLPSTRYAKPRLTFSLLRPIDNFLNNITMYRLITYYLLALIGVAVVFCFIGTLPYNPGRLVLSAGVLTTICWGANKVFASTFRVPANVESAFISAFILTLILTPPQTGHDLIFLAWAAILAMASKYILAIGGKHIFNPVAVSVAITALALNNAASWWVGTGAMLIFVVIGGLLIVRKIRRGNLVISFLAAAILTAIGFALLNGDDLAKTLQTVILSSPLLFFAFVILTEPLTTPPTNQLQMIYGALVGVLFAPQLHIGSLYSTPELAIVLGNVFSYAVSPKAKLMLRLKNKIRLSENVYEFIFVPNRRLAFAPGQYMEWTLGHDNPDSRGNRRYFTLASAPTEGALRLGVKFYDQSSTFKKSMLAMDDETQIVAGQLAGDFTLPESPRQPCVFIAGGIGITPFRSMIKYLVDKREQRPITLFYSNRLASEIVYQDVFDRAWRDLGIKTVYTLTDMQRIPLTWRGYTGYITPQMIGAEVPNYRNCLFYLSGPNAMVMDTESMLLAMGVPRTQIKTDFFQAWLEIPDYDVAATVTPPDAPTVSAAWKSRVPALSSTLPLRSR